MAFALNAGMTATIPDSPLPAACPPWTCPFCPLLCDAYSVATGLRFTLAGSDCPRAADGLAHFSGAPARPECPSVGGQSVDYAVALDAAAAILAASRQPLFGGLATDVAGVRALYRLANTCGAILDHARGDALMHSTRALQDRGVFYTTLAEIRNRADLIVCLGTNPGERYPEFFRRCAPSGDAPVRRVVFLGAGAAPLAAGLEDSASEVLPLPGDLFDTVSLLAARLAGRRTASLDAGLEALAARMLAARYTVLVWESGRLPAHGALIAEMVTRLANTLNQTTRAATFCLGGGDGGYTANQVVTWLSGLPLRTGVQARGLVHEPLRYATDRLLADGAVDALLWVSSFGPDLVPPLSALPQVVLGHPELQREFEAHPDGVFIPVSTPGIGSAGHLFRADGGVVLPLAALYADHLPTVAQVAADLTLRVAQRRVV